MSDTERLDAAAAKLESLPHAAMTYSWFDDRYVATHSWGPKQAAPLAELLRLLARHVAAVDALNAPGRSKAQPEPIPYSDAVLAALAVADAVLGVPATPKETT